MGFSAMLADESQNIGTAESPFVAVISMELCVFVGATVRMQMLYWFDTFI